MRKSSHDELSVVTVTDAVHECVAGWDKIAAELQRAITRGRTEKPILVVDCYPGVDGLAMLMELESRLAPALTLRAPDAYHSPEKIEKLVAPFVAREQIFFNHSRSLSLVNFFNAEPLWRLRRTIDDLKGGLVLIVGCGASLIAWGHILVYADLARREARQRFYREENCNLGMDNKSLSADLKCKHAFRVDWRVVDRWKRPLINRWDYALDINNPSEPKLADGEDVRRGLHIVARRPFRVVPSSDPDREAKDFGLLEENSLLLGFGDLRIEIPATDLVFNQPRALLGEAIHTRFGDEFPIRFDFLNTINGFEPLGKGDGWREERAISRGLTVIETRRHWFSKTVAHDTRGSVNVLNLSEGDEAIVESPDRAFEPFIVRHADTFIVPAAVGRYNIRPHGSSIGKEIATIKAFVRT